MATSPNASKRRVVVAECGKDSAIKVVRNIIGPAAELYQTELEILCKLSLSASKQNAVLAKHEAMKSNMKQPERKMIEMISSGINVLTEAQTKNYALRFGSEEGEKGLLQRPFSVFTGARNSFLNVVAGGMSSSSAVDSHDYEDVISESILKAPISELCVIQRGEPVPHGFLRISRTPTNKKANLNASSGGNHLFFCIKKDLSEEAIPITALVLIFPDRSEFVPPGYFVARHDKFACNLNSGTSAERIFLCYKKDKAANPITDIVVIFPGKSEEPPKSFNLIEKSPTNLPANLNTGTVGGRIFVCYRQSLVRLECLRNDVNRVPAVSSSASISNKERERTSAVSPLRPNGASAFTVPAPRANGSYSKTGSGQPGGGDGGEMSSRNSISPRRGLNCDVSDSRQHSIVSPRSTETTRVSQDELAAAALADFSDDEIGANDAAFSSLSVTLFIPRYLPRFYPSFPVKLSISIFLPIAFPEMNHFF